ncbi:hypothetical protein CH252_01925 [Rhodococcus sp. 06-1477-1B]|nr:acyltransferase [Rhodococcus fascians]MBY4060984.1 acyltransferase [Rhodococcus fascians]MBY4071154.1 acyltransferase [Rhodococcus fascians]OZD44392.1 hypothetical protein CH266_24500 [Rhodococcus sp. 06-1474-1B]OZD58656.1 hypothetical protein CH252_01925 [Rhodococcus sp. 06-1477-1B]
MKKKPSKTLRVRSEVRAWQLAIIQLVSGVLLPEYSFRRLRAALLRLGGLRIYLGCHVGGGFRATGTNLDVGRGTYIGPRCFMDINSSAWIRIGSDVAIGPQCTFLTSTHDFGSARKRAGRNIALPISVGDGSWIGGNVTVLPGVEIGAGSVVAASSTVTHSVAPNTLVGGIPARLIRTLSSPADAPSPI